MKTILLAIVLAFSFGTAAEAQQCISLAGLLALDDSTDDGPAFNAITGASGVTPGTCWVLPAGASLATSIKLRLTVTNTGLQFNVGSRIHALASMGDVGDVFDFAANGTWSQDMEIDCYGSSTHSISGWRTTGNVMGIRLLGRTFVQSCTQYGGHFTSGGDIYIEDYYALSTVYDGLHIQNAGNTADATVVAKRIRVDRSGVSSAQQPSVQIIGSIAHMTHVLVGDVWVAEPESPSNLTCEGMEIRYSDGHLTKFFNTGGSIGLSIASGTQHFAAGQVISNGASKIGEEVANSDSATTTSDIATGFVVVNGENAAGTAPLTQRAVAVDGGNDSHRIAFGTVVASNFLNDGWGVYASPPSTANSITDVSLSNAVLDASSTNAGAGLMEAFGVEIAATKPSSAAGAVTGVALGNVSVIGGGNALGCIQLLSVQKVIGTVGCTGIKNTGVLLRVNDDGNILATSDNIDLNVMDLGSNPTSAQLASTLTNGGVLGSNVTVGSASFIPFAAGFTGKVRDVKNKLWSAYSVSNTAPESALDGTIGSTVQFADGRWYWKSTAAGTLTGWLLRSAANGEPVTPPQTVGALGTCAPANQGQRSFVTDANSAVFGAGAVAGGANKVPVVCDGTTWVIGMLDLGSVIRSLDGDDRGGMRQRYG
jgi:hypothetical protein